MWTPVPGVGTVPLVQMQKCIRKLHAVWAMVFSRILQPANSFALASPVLQIMRRHLVFGSPGLDHPHVEPLIFDLLQRFRSDLSHPIIIFFSSVLPLRPLRNHH